MKKSLLKWAHHLNKGTTNGYATRKDCIVAFGFLFLFLAVSGTLYMAIGNALEMQDPTLYLKYFSFIVFVLTIIANFSMIIMRINDIFGKRYFTSKRGVFYFFLAVFLVELFSTYAFRELFDIQSSIDYGLFIYAIICLYPPSSKAREEMPIVEHKLPKKFIIFLFVALVVAFGLVLQIAFETSRLESGY